MMTDSTMETGPSLREVRRAVVAGCFGNVLEWFDFTVYGLLATVTASHFFTAHSGSGGAVSLLLTFATFGVGFVARPVGGLVIGRWIADRRGRRTSLVFSIAVMGISTGVMGLIPSYQSIGVLAPVILLLARLIQGFAAGGEWGGAASFLVEWAPPRHRGFVGSFHGASIFVGTVLGSFVIALMTSVFGAATMSAWAWRVPFLLGAVICIIAIPFRLAAEETPAFVRAVAAAEAKSRQLPGAREGLPRRQLVRALLLTFAIGAMPSAAVYTFVNYFPTFVQTYVGGHTPIISAQNALWSNAIAAFTVIVVEIATAALSDKIGRKPLMLASSIGVLVLAYPITLLVLHARSFLAVMLLQMSIAAVIALALGILQATLAELFPTRVRVAGLSVAYNISSAVFGGFAPFLATALITWTGAPAAASLWTVFAAVITLIAAIVMKETKGIPLSPEAAEIEEAITT